MNKRVRRNFKRYYDRNEIRYLPVFCIYEIIGDYRFIFETAYIKERFVPSYAYSFSDEYEKMKNGDVFDGEKLKGIWVFETAMPKKEAFIDAIQKMNTEYYRNCWTNDIFRINHDMGSAEILNKFNHKWEFCWSDVYNKIIDKSLYKLILYRKLTKDEIKDLFIRLL